MSGLSQRSPQQPIQAVSGHQSDIEVLSSASGSFVNGKHVQTMHSCNNCYKTFSKVDKQHIPLVLVSCGHILCSNCIYQKLKAQAGSVKCPLCNQVTKILNCEEHDLANFDVEQLIKLIPRNQALMNIMEEEFIEEVQVKVPPSQVIFGSKGNESQGQNKLTMMTPLTKLDKKLISNISDSPLDDENHFNTDAKNNEIEICEEDSCVYSDNGGADSVRQSVIVMQ